jgi:hypothetical protein
MGYWINLTAKGVKEDAKMDEPQRRGDAEEDAEKSKT